MTYEHTNYMSISKENQIFWWEIRGDHIIPEKGSPRKVEDDDKSINLTTDIIADETLAIGRIRIQVPYSTKTQWTKIMGLKYTQDPECLEGQCLSEGIEKLLLHTKTLEEAQTATEREKGSVIICSRYWQTFNQDQLNRWKIYSTLTPTSPDQTEFNTLIGALTRKTWKKGFS